VATDPEDPKAKLDSKRLLTRCEACGLDVEWTTTREQYFLTTVVQPGQRRPIGMPLHPMICNNCGLVRLFHANLP
jgi:hypothetical protein